mmetsp:Transcript_29483/g.64412  ORF Transcript_29483/g.64412 Transcript_29483/m.64412 type:complete len:200 (-) Transcript_29483:45-644(-)
MCELSSAEVPGTKRGSFFWCFSRTCSSKRGFTSVSACTPSGLAITFTSTCCFLLGLSEVASERFVTPSPAFSSCTFSFPDCELGAAERKRLRFFEGFSCLIKRKDTVILRGAVAPTHTLVVLGQSAYIARPDLSLHRSVGETTIVTISVTTNIVHERVNYEDLLDGSISTPWLALAPGPRWRKPGCSRKAGLIGKRACD